MIYFIEAVGSSRIKIGFAKDVDRRIEALKTGCPFEMKLLGAIPGEIRNEKILHKHFSHLRVSGEWFHASEEILSYINDQMLRTQPTFNGLPLLFGVCEGPIWGEGRRFCYLKIQCPKCGIELNHSFMPGNDWKSPQKRSPHCSCWKTEYYIEASHDLSVHKIDPTVKLTKQWVSR